MAHVTAMAPAKRSQANQTRSRARTRHHRNSATTQIVSEPESAIPGTPQRRRARLPAACVSTATTPNRTIPFRSRSTTYSPARHCTQKMAGMPRAKARTPPMTISAEGASNLPCRIRKLTASRAAQMMTAARSAPSPARNNEPCLAIRCGSFTRARIRAISGSQGVKRLVEISSGIMRARRSAYE